mmetsp:Transcript_39332/g.103756  ORF Transcript_39332/g.103756 Transcript_39332/m.103756 type:complete len:255 (-) Transcript_39332:47-811(-)
MRMLAWCHSSPPIGGGALRGRWEAITGCPSQTLASIPTKTCGRLGARGRGVTGRAVAAGRLRPARVDDLVEHVDQAVVGRDVGLVAGARRRVGHVGEGVVEEVLAEHAAVGDRGALERGKLAVGERVRVDDALDDVVLADRLGQLAARRGELVARVVARREDGDVRLVEVNAVRLAGTEEGGVRVELLEVGLLERGVLERALLAPVDVRSLDGRERVASAGHHGRRHAHLLHHRHGVADDEGGRREGSDGKHDD